MILMNGNDPYVDVSQIGWILPHTDFPHYHPSFLDYLGLFSGTYLLPQIPNLSPVCTTAPPPDLFPRIFHAPRRLISFNVFDITPLRGQTVPPFARAPYLRDFYVFIPSMWIPKKTPRIRSRRGFLNILQTFFLCVSLC